MSTVAAAAAAPVSIFLNPTQPTRPTTGDSRTMTPSLSSAGRLIYTAGPPLAAARARQTDGIGGDHQDTTPSPLHRDGPRSLAFGARFVFRRRQQLDVYSSRRQKDIDLVAARRAVIRRYTVHPNAMRSSRIRVLGPIARTPLTI